MTKKVTDLLDKAGFAYEVYCKTKALNLQTFFSALAPLHSGQRIFGPGLPLGLRGGQEIAVIESSGQFVHEEDDKAHSVMNKAAVSGFYRIWTREENLDAVFITAMAFARTGALNDVGGAFGKQIRTAVFGKK